MTMSWRGVLPATALVFGTLMCLWLSPAAGADSPSDGVSILAFTASPRSVGARTEAEPVETLLNITLQNTGGTAANVTLTVTEKARTLHSKSVTIMPNGTFNLSLGWTLRGAGDHTVVAAIAGENVTAPATMQATCNVRLLPLVEHPSPWYTIPCAFMFITIPIVVIWLFIRRMKGGDWLDRWAKR
jgi:hypothetical protein